VRVRRGERQSELTKTLQVLLSPDEHEELERLAVSRGLSTSTVAREAILADLPLTVLRMGPVAVSVSRHVKLSGQLARETMTRNG
jgi:uncharacterized membrane protein (DUF4010 family)